MHRAACTLALLLLVPLASADPLVEASVGPEQGYYLKVTASEPERPHGSASEADDCARDARPSTTDAAAAGLVAPFLSGEVPLVTTGTTAPYVPGCVAAPVATCAQGMCLAAAHTYASYDVATGRYYVELPATASPALPTGPRPASGPGLHLSGTTGVGAEGDCEACPPPGRLA